MTLDPLDILARAEEWDRENLKRKGAQQSAAYRAAAEKTRAARERQVGG